MKKISLSLIVLIVFVSCKHETKEENNTVDSETTKLEITKIQEEKFDVINDSLKFNSATIENFDDEGNSIDVYWIGKERDTTLRFYRKYDTSKNLIGAEYYEQGDVEPTKDTVYINTQGLKVEASMNNENKITWKSTQYTDANGNKVLSRYENGKGEYRGLDSLFYDDQNRVVKGFYENTNGKRYSIKTYKYLKSDEYGNWTERQMFKNDTLNQKQIRILKYSK